MPINTSRQSPNHSSRVGHPIRVVILHATVGSLKSSLNWLCSPASRVSTHYVISKTGVIYQLVAETEAAWHAGTAIWQGETAVNEISIGVELENSNTGKDPYPAVQLDKLTELARNLMGRIPNIAFARHLDVALPKGRKTDPAGFPWTTFRATLASNPPVSLPKRYRVKADMFWLEAPRADAPIANQGRALLQVGDVVAINDVSNGWAHAQNEIGFTLMAGLEAV